MLTPLWALIVQSRVESAYSSSLAEEERLALGPLLALLAEAGAFAPAWLSTAARDLPTLAACSFDGNSHRESGGAAYSEMIVTDGRRNPRNRNV